MDGCELEPEGSGEETLDAFAARLHRGVEAFRASWELSQKRQGKAEFPSVLSSDEWERHYLASFLGNMD